MSKARNKIESSKSLLLVKVIPLVKVSGILTVFPIVIPRNRAIITLFIAAGVYIEST
jgi:hypothetical protein